jgi:hypothetical protein
VCEPGASDPSQLAVTLTVPASEATVFRLDDDVMGTAGMAALISNESATDDHGPLLLVREVRDGTLELAPSRPASGTVTLRYHAKSVATTVTGAREGLRHDATGIVGDGRHFLVLPESQHRYKMRIAWDAPLCPTSTRGDGASTFAGDVVGPLTDLREGAYYWGRPQLTTVEDGALHLRIAWFGEPVFDVAIVGAWAAKILAAERDFFADDDPSLYSVVVRVLQSQDDRANGVGRETSFLSAIGPRLTFARRLKVNFAHEMLHRWLGMRLRLRGAEGTAYWFTEGFTVHFSNRITFRAGLLTIDEFLESLNDTTSRHFANKHARATNDEIARRFFKDQALAIVPYTRGALYAAELDAALRKAGKRSLDELLRGLYQQARAAHDGLPANSVRQLVQAELGRAGVERYDAVIVHGSDPDPPSGAYGPCFERVRAPQGFSWARVSGVTDEQCRAW